MSEQLEEASEVPVSFRMPEELHTRLKIVAAKRKMTVKEILNGLVETWVKKQEDA
jgi:predicted DNA-binding protein